MAGVAVDFEAVLDDEEVQGMLRALIARGCDLRPILKKVMVYMQQSIAKTFRVGGRPTRWKPLSPVTIERRRKSKQKRHAYIVGPQILRDTGRLFASVTGSTHDAVRQVGPTVMVLGTRVEYATVHQLGRRRMPATVNVPEHWVKQHTRTVTKVFGRPVEPRRVTVRRHKVRAHTKRTILPAIPARPFLQWLPEDVKAVRDIIQVELLRSA